MPYDLNRAVSIALHTPQLPMLETYINETVTAVYSRSYKPNTNTPQTNPWEELPLSVYHCKPACWGCGNRWISCCITSCVTTRKKLSPLRHYRWRGLENAPLAHDTRIIGVDIN